ncbi:hypothetical protein BDW02DRAFT_622729 [Decorospora gaudefroyi]|uniref:F-box domain-containing protein n=1 Tax=Decorospora gaudefroyi TaxID=184978 RepID=A0A6A5KEB3_9PLEO|nr:hypothetical protein BDW02DRAFT_622729 [Decorospora gaudefroyi]
MSSQPHILSLPTEVLHQILQPLPIPSLLAFSSTCHHAHHLATTNLHTLSLGIRPLATPPTHNPGPYEIWLRIPKTHAYDYTTLFNFQSALFSSILGRHGALLQHLDLCIWALTGPMGHAIANLSALRTLGLRVENAAYGRALPPRACVALERSEQAKAWAVLSRSAVWRERLLCLRLENVEVGVEALAGVLAEARCCREVRLRGCRFLGRELWGVLGSGRWAGGDSLRVLGVADCGLVLGEEAWEGIGRLGALRCLDLGDCQAVDSAMFEMFNRDVWHIPEFVPPKDVGSGDDMVIEVDPEYMS